MHRFFIALFLAAALAGCGSLPKPFLASPRAIADSPLLDVPTAVGIAILPVKGMPEPFSGQLGEALAERFEVLEIPAQPVTVNKGLGFDLQGDAQEIATSTGGLQIAINWRVKSRRGALAADYRQTAIVLETAWRSGDKAEAARIALEAATKLAAIIAGEPPRQATAIAPAAKPKYPSVSLRSVQDAPGDGRESLRLAVLQVLAENGVRRDDVQPEIVLHCAVKREPVNDASQRVEIIWRAVGRDGKEVGTVKLENTVPTGALDGPWGPTAFAIANAAAGDLLRLLNTASAVANPQQPGG